MRKKLINALLISFITLSIVSILVAYQTHATPLEQKIVTPLYTYANYGTYSYVASLRPNTVYDNKTTLEPGEGPVYRRITNYVDINFTYTFEGSLPTNLTIQYQLTEYVETPQWTKTIYELPRRTITANGTETTLTINSIPFINVSSVFDLVKAVQADTGLSISAYSANIRIEMYIEAETNERVINESFSPTLKMEFESSKEEGDVISITGLEDSNSGEITQTETVYHSWVQSQRYISYVLSTVTFFGLVMTTWAFMRTRPHKPPKPEKLFEDFIAPYEEIIAETIQEPSVEKPRLAPVTMIIVETMEDLVKIAEILGKPILHTYQSPENHIFYVFDGTTRYEFTTTVSSMAERKTSVEREENEWENNQN